MGLTEAILVICGGSYQLTKLGGTYDMGSEVSNCTEMLGVD